MIFSARGGKKDRRVCSNLPLIHSRFSPCAPPLCSPALCSRGSGAGTGAQTWQRTEEVRCFKLLQRTVNVSSRNFHTSARRRRGRRQRGCEAAWQWQCCRGETVRVNNSYNWLTNNQFLPQISQPNMQLQ